jgi:hypothetical protein
LQLQQQQLPREKHCQSAHSPAASTTYLQLSPHDVTKQRVTLDKPSEQALPRLLLLRLHLRLAIASVAADCRWRLA